jgi:hypothetical protein
MAYVVGAMLALAVGGSSSAIGLDRDRAFYSSCSAGWLECVQPDANPDYSRRRDAQPRDRGRRVASPSTRRERMRVLLIHGLGCPRIFQVWGRKPAKVLVTA